MTDSGESTSTMNSTLLQKYSLVRFVHKGKKRKCEEIDIVPSKWLSYDKRKKRCTTQFLKPPYEEEAILLLHSLVQTAEIAPADWPTYTVEMIGRAGEFQRFIYIIY